MQSIFVLRHAKWSNHVIDYGSFYNFGRCFEIIEVGMFDIPTLSHKIYLLILSG